MARTYRRDPRGRFSSTGGSGAGRKLAARMVSRGKNRLTRDNAGRITSVGGQGATARGGRLRTAAGNKRATQLAKLKGTGSRLRKPMGGGVAPKVAAKGGGVKRVGSGPVDSAAKSKRLTKQQKADAYIQRISKVGEGRTGVKARRAARIREKAASYAQGLASYHKRSKPRTREDMKKGLSEAFGNEKRMKAYSKFRKDMKLESRPQSGKRSLVRAGQIKRAEERLSKTVAAIRAPFSKWNPNPARQNNAINRRSAQIVERASKWYQGDRSSGKAKPLAKVPVMASAQSAARSGGPKLNAFQRSDAKYAKRKYGVRSTISNPGRKSQRSPRRALQSGQRVAITGRTRKQIQQSYAKTVTNKLFDNYNRGITRNAGPKLRIAKQALYDQFSVFGGSGTVSRTRATRPRRRR